VTCLYTGCPWLHNVIIVVIKSSKLRQDQEEVLSQLAANVSKRLPSSVCTFAISKDRNKYEFSVEGGNPSIIAWATNNPKWKGYLAATWESGFLYIYVRQDIILWDSLFGKLRWLTIREGDESVAGHDQASLDPFTYSWRMPAHNHSPSIKDAGELRFTLMPFGIGYGGCMVPAGEPMGGFSLVEDVLFVAAEKSLRKWIPKRSSEYLWLLKMGYLGSKE
jgi:hypothetical protein